ncbi:nucleoprotein TPR-like [Lytechinus variegatus]|uniref:nucleoprotein TPR-like n=1 Tax=Lytechinus variegatus TaxID=7654 RepID=UPI001BB14219|nr:nucleoprotein TPR-like [Lytechinus variegatus]
MGHGASTNVKKVALIKDQGPEDSDESRPVWTRSNSDGCIVENLNSSKTKVDLLDQQVSEYKELFRTSELKLEETVDRANTLEKQLAEVEGVNFELTDTVSDLQQQLESLQANSGSEVNRQLEEELTTSIQQVEKLEMHVKLLEEQMASMRSKFRKKLRAANTEVTESKQDASLKLYSLKDQIKQLEEENLKLTERLDLANSRPSKTELSSNQTGGDDSRMMVILELSNQVSAQEDQIIQLQEQLQEKDKTIKELTNHLDHVRTVSQALSELGSRPPSGATTRPLSGRSQQQSSRSGHVEARKGSERSVRSGKSSEGIQGDELDVHVHVGDHQEVIGRHVSGSTVGECDDIPRDKERTSSGKSGRRQSSSQERRKSGNQDERTRGGGRRYSERSSSADVKEVRGHRRKKSTSGSQPNDASAAELPNDGFVAEGNSNTHSAYADTTENLTRDQIRINSAGSQDSAFHESPLEGTKSAPSSAGTSRHRRRLKAAQQRASSLETIDHSGLTSPKPPLKPETNLYEQDLGVGNDLGPASSRSTCTKECDQDLDDLLQELMSDEGSKDTGWKKNSNSNHGFGVSEEKIRSLLSDSAS